MVNQHTIIGLEQVGSRLRMPVLQADGVKWLHVMPAVIFTLRAAEYGIDPTDTQTLVDWVLHEKFVQMEYTHPSFLYNTDETTARTYMKAQIVQAKQSDIFVDPDNYLDAIHTHYKPDMDLHTSHRGVVASIRARNLRAVVSPVKPYNGWSIPSAASS